MTQQKESNNNIIIIIIAIILVLVTTAWFYFSNKNSVGTNNNGTGSIEANKDAENIDKKDMKVEIWDTVSVNYTWKFENWEKFDSSYDRKEPIKFKTWEKQMIPWFENATIWMKIWEKKTITLKPADAYGEYSSWAIQDIPRTELKQLEEQWFKVELWAKVPSAYWELPILAIDDKAKTVKIDMNHPMAWKTLVFDIEIVDIKRVAPRVEEKAKLEVFLMWYCPYGEIAAKAIPTLQTALKDDVKLDFHYIATKTWEWFKAADFESLHWVTEAEEDIRQLCIKKHYNTNTLVSYMQTRYANADNHWVVKDDKKLAYDANKIDAKKIDDCVENWEWGKLLAEDIKLAEELEIWGSPTWLTNNKYNFGWIEASAIQIEFCKYNADLAGCKTAISNTWTNPASNVACEKS